MLTSLSPKPKPTLINANTPKAPALWIVMDHQALGSDVVFKALSPTKLLGEGNTANELPRFCSL